MLTGVIYAIQYDAGIGRPLHGGTAGLNGAAGIIGSAKLSGVIHGLVKQAAPVNAPVPHLGISIAKSEKQQKNDKSDSFHIFFTSILKLKNDSKAIRPGLIAVN